MLAKRALDVMVSLLALALLLPVLISVAVYVKARLGSPVIFQQTRPGLKGRPFKLLKFRTLTDEVGADGLLLPDEKRLTPAGSLLRSTSLDELPAFWNVLVGDMSLVGPRPLLMEYLDLYTPEQARRLDVRPGITGWAQINGRNSLSWEDKFAHDVWYVNNRTLLLDLKILFRTLLIVVSREGITSVGSATAERFQGK